MQMLQRCWQVSSIFDIQVRVDFHYIGESERAASRGAEGALDATPIQPLTDGSLPQAANDTVPILRPVNSG